MLANLIKIGNSKGVRLPASFLKQCNIDSKTTKVELTLTDNQITIKPINVPREGWAFAFKTMSKNNDDELLISNSLDNELLEAW